MPTRSITHEQIRDAIRGFVAASFRDGRTDGLAPETPLVTSGIVDSAGVLELVEWLERRFAIRIEDEAIAVDTFDTLDAVARLVGARLARRGA